LLQPDTVEIVMPPIPICLSFSFTTGILSDLIIASTFFMWQLLFTISHKLLLAGQLEW
jgi:hypothetical protein